MTSGLEMESPVYRKRNGEWLCCSKIQTLSLGHQGRDTITLRKIGRLSKGWEDGGANGTTHLHFRKAQNRAWEQSRNSDKNF